MELQFIFSNLLHNFGTNEQDVHRLWHELESLYTGKKRHYHNLNHLSDLFEQLKPLEAKIMDWEVLLFSLFYHDAIYISTRKDNEEKSAQLAKQRMQEIGISSVQIQKCVQQIVATKGHTVSDDEDTNYFTDADLSILGRDWDTYKNYCDAIRKEYSIYPTFMYRRGRKKVLKHFLAMEQIFKTKEFFATYEENAQFNLKRELSNL